MVLTMSRVKRFNKQTLRGNQHNKNISEVSVLPVPYNIYRVIYIEYGIEVII